MEYDANLYTASVTFNFHIDTRGPWPVMVSGLRAATYRTRRDLLDFISVLSPERAEQLNQVLGTY